MVTREVPQTPQKPDPSDGHAWLVPHNPAYLPILAGDATILGTVVAVARRIRFTPPRP